MESNSGDVAFTNEKFSVANAFTLNSSSAFVTLKNLKATSINLNAKSGKIYADILTGAVAFGEDTIDCDFDVNTIKGSLLIGSLEQENVKPISNINIMQKLDGTAIIATKGNIHIKEVAGKASIKNVNGEINVEKNAADLNINTVSSNIILGKLIDSNNNFVANGIGGKVAISATEKANIEAYFGTPVAGTSFTTKGNISAHFAPTANVTVTSACKKAFLNGEEQTVAGNVYNFSQNAGTNLISFATENEVKLYTK